MSRSAILEIITRKTQHERKRNRAALAIGDVVIIRGKDGKRDLSRLRIVVQLFNGKDEPAAKIRCGKSELERAAQHL